MTEHSTKIYLWPISVLNTFVKRTPGIPSVQKTPRFTNRYICVRWYTVIIHVVYIVILKNFNYLDENIFLEVHKSRKYPALPTFFYTVNDELSQFVQALSLCQTQDFYMAIIVFQNK